MNDECTAVSLGGLHCDLPADHVQPQRRIAHDFSGRSGYCRVCTCVRRRASEFDCTPLPPTPHRAVVTW